MIEFSNPVLETFLAVPGIPLVRGIMILSMVMFARGEFGLPISVPTA